MSAPVGPRRQGALGGTAVLMFAEGISLPAALVTAAVLTRGLGPEDYGRFTVVATLVTTLEWLLVAIFGRAVTKFIAEAGDWRPVAATAARAYMVMALTLAGALALFAGPIATALNDPPLQPYLRLFALEIPLFAVLLVGRDVLVGTGRYRQQAVAGATRWLGRMALIVLFVQLGWAIRGAILGGIGGIALTAAVCLILIGPGLFGRPGFPLRELVQLALPAFLLMLTVRIFDRIGLLMLSGLRGAGEEVGYYSAAQNLSMVTGVIAMTVAPIIISTTSAARRDGRHEHARTIAHGGIRASIALLPFAAIVAGSAEEIFALLFGAAFVPAAVLGQWLVFVAVGLVVISVTTALLVARGLLWGTVLLTAPLLPLSVIGHLVLIPRLGALGAAAVTTVTALACAVVCVVMTQRELRLPAVSGTVVRCIAIGTVVWAAAAAWPAPGVLVVGKSAVLALAVSAGLLLTGELDGEERSAVRAWIGGLRGGRAGA